MKVVAIVQARLASTRLPAKVLLDLGGVTALERCIRRVRNFPNVSDVVVATSDSDDGDIIASLSRRIGVQVFRGSESDVLSRYAGAAKEHQADVVIRCTSDCPLLDPACSGDVIQAFLDGGVDYASNTLDRRLPRGLDTEVFSADALYRAERDATDPGEREHVTMRLYRRVDLFKTRSVVGPDGEDHSNLRFTLDTLLDYRFLFSLFERLGDAADEATLAQILATLGREPKLVDINRTVVQKTT